MRVNAFLINFWFVLILLISNVNAQTDTKTATKKQLLKQAEAYYDSSQYEAALPYYLKLYDLDSNNVVYNLAIGICYLNVPKNKIKAIPFLEKVIVKRGVLSKEARYYLGKAYHLAGRFDEAIAMYEKYKSSSNKSDDRFDYVSRQIEMCKVGRELIKNPVNVSLVNLAAFINTPYPEYSPLITGDDSTMIFTSRRPGSTGDLRTDNNGFYEDIYISYKVNDTIWSSPQGIGSSINSPMHDAGVGISQDGQELYIYSDDDGDGNIYVCTLSGDVWSAPKKLNSNINTSAFEPSACVSPDGNDLYFISDRKGGFGGKDIYRSSRKSNGDWGPAVNLGKTVNTPYDEDGPFMHADNTSLYFSSTGHSSMGGYDIFLTTLNDTSWSEPKNIGYPINTVDDDIYFVRSPNGRHAYYSSIKQNGVGEKDIYMVEYPADEETKNLILVKGRLRNKDNENVNAMIEVKNKQTNKVIARSTSNSKTGKYLIFIKPGVKYDLSITTMDKSLAGKAEFSLPDLSKYYEVYQHIQLNKNNELAINYIYADSIKKETVVIDEEAEFIKLMNQSKIIASDTSLLNKAIAVLPVEAKALLKKGKGSSRDEKSSPDDRVIFKTLFFEFNSNGISADGKKELDAIFKILVKSPAMKATISGYTDNKGEESVNQELSEKRAKVVLNYLKSKGIKASRMTTKGFGKSEPFATNDTEEGRQANRRVEVKISKE